MSIYKGLLLEAGGGIISRRHQAERTNDAMVAIGLGGTGTDALIRLKSEIYQHLKADDENETPPQYRNLHFLAIDSEASRIDRRENQNLLQAETEYFDLSCPHLREMFHAKDLLNCRKEMEWLNHEEISIRGSSTGGIRQIGRYLLMQKSTELKAKLRSIILDATRGCTGDLYVHVFSGISGGTGSGTFLDVCYILRHILEEFGRHNAIICGYFFLPDVNLSVPEVAADSMIHSYLMRNGYAALKELDYLMNLKASRDKFSQSYGSFSYETSLPPVDLCYLVSATNTEGNRMKDGYNYAMHVVADYVLSSMVKAHGAYDYESERRIEANLTTHARNMIQGQHGAFHGYCIIGAAKAEIPVKQMLTYLASGIFQQCGDLYMRMPTEDDLHNFIQNNQITYENILAELCEGVEFQIEFPDIPIKALKESLANADCEEPCLAASCETWCVQTNKLFLENMKALMEPMDGTYQFRENTKSLTAKIYHELLAAYVTAPEYGPFFAKHLLYSTTQKSLTNVIDGYVKKNAELKAAEVRQDDLRRQELQDAADKFRRSTFLSERNKYQIYVQTIERWYIHLTKIEMYTFMETLLMDFKRGIAELDQNFFHVLTTVLETLKETFAKNRWVLKEGMYREQEPGYAMHILSVLELQADLDVEVQRMDMKHVMQRFLEMMIEQHQKWRQMNEADIVQMVSDFMNHQFETVINQMIFDYLLQQCGMLNGTALTKEICSALFERAKPLFWQSPLVEMPFHADESALLVPFDSPETVNTVNDFVDEHRWFRVQKTGMADQILMTQVYSGVPLYAYAGLTELEEEYENHIVPGLHLYEKNIDWSTYLPSPIPVSFKPKGYFNPRVEYMNERYLEEYEEAKRREIIIEDAETKKRFFHKSKAFDLADTKRKYESYKTDGIVDIGKAELCQTRLQELMQKLYDEAEWIEIANNGDAWYREQTFRDNYCKYPQIRRMVREELEKKTLLSVLLETIEKDIRTELRVKR